MSYFYVYPFAVDGDRSTVPTDYGNDGFLSYEKGFTSDYQLILGTDPTAKPISRTQTNQIYYDITSNLRQYQTQGLPAWVSPAENVINGVPTPLAYDLYAWVRHNDGSGVKVYENLVHGNTDEPTISAQSWFVISGSQGQVPTGTITHFGAPFAPDGYLLCDGSQISRTAYSRLFSVIGETWGAGDGVNTFNLPLLPRHVLVGAGGSATTTLGNQVGDTGGAEAVQLKISEMPEHTHRNHISIRTQTHATSPGNISLQGLSLAGQVTNLDPPSSTLDAGGNASHNNMQPSAVVYMVIKD